MHNVMCHPVQLCTPAQTQAGINFLLEILFSVLLSLVQYKDATEVFYVVNTSQLWNSSMFHLKQ